VRPIANYVGSPFVSFDSISHNGSRLWNIVSFNEFQDDFAKKQVPQYAFMTPNMMNDGHNTTLEFATEWAHHFLEPLLAPDAFNEPTLILLTYDESETYEKPNKIASLLLGSAVPARLRGTEDETFYTHYSMLATIEHNWDLPNLGRYDVDANVFQFVRDQPGGSGPPNRDRPEYDKVDNSVSYPGFLNNDPAMWKPIPAPNLSLFGASGLPVLDKIRQLYVTRYGEETAYDGSGAVYDGVNEPVYRPQPADPVHGAHT
jgi:acid phosphatase